jgi:phospholipid N-methyltransferase
LPDVPSAKEVEKNGLALGKMNTILVKKVEEQTLYIIELNKQLQQLKKEKDEEQKINLTEIYKELKDMKKQVDELKSNK